MKWIWFGAKAVAAIGTILLADSLVGESAHKLVETVVLIATLLTRSPQETR